MSPARARRLIQVLPHAAPRRSGTPRMLYLAPLLFGLVACGEFGPMEPTMTPGVPSAAIADETTADEILRSQIQDFADDGVLNRGQAEALLRKLERALAHDESGRVDAAVVLMDALIAQLESFVAEDVLTAAEADLLIAPAMQYRAALSGDMLTRPVAYVVNTHDDINSTVTVLDTDSRSVITEFTVGNQPVDVAFSPDGTRAYVANFGGGISVIETATHTVLTTIPSPNPQRIDVTQDGSAVYVAGFGGLLSAIDPSTNTVIGVKLISNALWDVEVSPDGGTLYLSDFDNDLVHIVDAATFDVEASVAVGDFPGDMTLSPDGTDLYVSNLNGGSLSVISTASRTVVSTIALRGNPRQLVFNPAGTRAYVIALFGDPSVEVLDVASGTVVESIKVGTFLQESPLDLDITPDGAHLFVTRTYFPFGTEGDVVVIETATNTLLADAIPVGVEPQAIAASLVPVSP